MGDDNTNSEATISAYFVCFSTLLAVVLILSKLLQDHKRLASLLPEAGMILLVGMAAGALVHALYGDERISRARGIDSEFDDDVNVDYEELVNNVLSFSPNAFFVALLPPIIFNSGYHLRRELFFRHIYPIALLAVVGTLVSALVIAFGLKFITLLGWSGDDFEPTFTELLTFGALISATDPVSTLAVFQVKRVDPQLFYLVFGESVLNDAVGLVLFETFCKFVQRDNGAGKIAMGFVEFIFGFAMDAVASPILGWVCAVGAALLFKHVDLRKTKLLELALFLLIMYVPFLIAEVFHLSGIVTILVTGIAARHYVEPNLSESTQDVADVIFRLSAHLAETSIFLELGLSVVGVTDFLQWKFIGWALLMCLLARASHVYPITLFFNQFLQKDEETCFAIFGHKLKEGMDGVMKMEFGDIKPAKSSDSNKSTSRKPMTGNLELAEHLNDFSNHHNQRKASNSSSTNGAEPNVDDGPTIPEAPEIVRTVSATPSLTPVPKRDMKIQPQTAHMVWFSGLRGAVAYACVRSFPDTFHHEREFTSTTMMIVLITVFCMGGATEAVLQWLNIEMNVNEEEYMKAWQQSEQAPAPGFWTYLDKRFVQQYVIRDHDTAASSLESLSSLPTVAKNSPVHAKQQTLQRHGHNSSDRVLPTLSIEMTESNHYDTLQEMGIPVPSPARRKTSLFDYGLKSD